MLPLNSPQITTMFYTEKDFTGILSDVETKKEVTETFKLMKISRERKLVQ